MSGIRCAMSGRRNEAVPAVPELLCCSQSIEQVQA